MAIELKCLCGHLLKIASHRAGGRVNCPACGRPNSVPLFSESALPPDSRRSGWLTVGLSGLGVLLIVITFLWALLAGGGTGGNGGGSGSGAGLASSGTGPGESEGDDPYAGRKNRGTEGGGEGSGSGEGPAGSQPSNSTANSTPAASRPSSRPATVPVEDVTPEPPAIASLTPRPLTPTATSAPAAPSTGGRTGVGGGGAYGQRGDSATARGNGATAQSEEAVELGLAWLAKVQNDDGSWTYDGTRGISDSRKGHGQYTLGTTGLATLAFLGAGYTHEGKSKYASTIRKALDWMLKRQDEFGDFQWETFYEQGIATMAICEAYGMTRDGRLRHPAQKGIDFVVKNMAKNGGYGYRGPGDDVHVTSFQVMAAKSGVLAKLTVPKEALTTYLRYYDDSLNPNGTTGYSSGRQSGSPASARTALGLFCRFFLGVGPKDPIMQKIAKVVFQAGPQTRDVFQTYYGTYAMFQMGGDYWKKWNEKFRDPVVALQVKEGEDKGSWASGSWHSGGRVCTTAVYIMALEVYYRFLPINR